MHSEELMAKLKAAQRNKIPASKFGLPGRAKANRMLGK